MNEIKNRGWSVTMAGLGINLALGILYTWSIFKQAIKESVMAKDGVFNWDMASLNDPFAVCCLMFTVAMVFAGRIQDKLSPRVTAVIGGILTGAGLIVISQSNALFCLDSGLRRSHRPGVGVWVCIGHTAGDQMVSRLPKRA